MKLCTLFLHPDFTAVCWIDKKLLRSKSFIHIPEKIQKKVLFEISFASEKDLNTIVEMGFEQGFSMAHENLDELFAQVVHIV